MLYLFRKDRLAPTQINFSRLALKKPFLREFEVGPVKAINWVWPRD